MQQPSHTSSLWLFYYTQSLSKAFVWYTLIPAIFYLTIAVVHHIYLEGGPLRYMVPLALLSGLLCLATFLLCYRRLDRLNYKTLEAIFCISMGIIAANSLAHLWLGQDLKQSLNLVILPVLSAVLLRSRWAFGLLVSAIIIAWVVVLSLVPVTTFEDKFHYFYVVVISVVAGLIVFNVVNATVELAIAKMEVEHQLSLTLEQRNKELAQLAEHDLLTGLPNRRGMQRFIELIWPDNTKFFSVILCDVDWFKKINDTYGHLEGDLVLQHVATLMKSQLRATDFIARYGGEEFVILAPNLDPQEASVLAERIVNAVRHSLELTVTMSAGVYTRSPACTMTIDDAFHHADSALYQAKQTGRDRVCVYSHVASPTSITTSTDSPPSRAWPHGDSDIISCSRQDKAGI